MKGKYTRAWLAAVFVSVTLFGCTTVIHSYGYNDDYVVLFDTLTGSFAAFDHVLTRDGRLVTALLVEAGFNLAASVEDLRMLRAASLLFSGLAACVYFLIARASGFGNLFSASLAVVTFTTPAFAVYNSWAICFPYPAGALLGLLSGLSIHTGMMCKDSDYGKRSALVVTGILLTVVCYWIYQPIAFFSLLSGSVLMWKDISSSRRRIVSAAVLVLIFVACSGLYVLVNNQLLKVLDLPVSGRTAWVDDIPARALYIVNHTLPAAGGGWLAVLGPLKAQVVAALSALIILFSCSMAGIRGFSVRVSFSLGILFLSIFTYSLLRDTYLAYRMYSGPSAWILFLIWWALSRICEEWRPLQQKRLKLASLYLAGGLFAAWLLAYLFIPSIHLQRLNEEEFAAIRESAEDVLVEIPPGLDIVLPAHYERTLMEVFWGEFKTRSSHMPWVAQKMVSLAVTESLQGSLPEKILKPGFKPIDLFYATNSRTGRPVLDIFGIVHKGDWDWITHPLFGKCRKVDHLAFCHSPEFGVFDNSDYPYVYHLGLGWIYASHPDQSLAVLMEHGNRECRFSESTFPVLDIPGEPPLLYEPRIGFQPKVVPVSP